MSDCGPSAADPPTYRTLLSAPGMRAWLLVAATAKLPVAMAPLALVFLVRQSSGGYTLGATLGGAYVLGEVVGALVLGVQTTRRRMRRRLAAGLLAGAAAFAALAVSGSAPEPLLIALALVAGGAPAANPGGLRAALVELSGEQQAVRALSVETSLTQLLWAAAPAAVAYLALGVSSGAPLVLAAVSMVVAALGLRSLPLPAAHGTDGTDGPDVTGGEDPASRSEPVSRIIAWAWPIFLTSAAAMALLATAELVLPALLQSRGLPVGWSGPLLTGFSIASVLGGLAYGSRTWRGTAQTQSLVLLVAMAVSVSLLAVLRGLVGIAAGLLLAGVFKAGVMVTRNVSLRDVLPTGSLTAGYSMMYAVQGIGYSVTASVAAVVLAAGRPAAAILTGASITLVLTIVSSLAERRRSHRLAAGTAHEGDEPAPSESLRRAS